MLVNLAMSVLIALLPPPPIAPTYWGHLIPEIWGETMVEEVLTIIECESRNNPNSVNNKESHGSSYGLLQIAGPWVDGWIVNGRKNTSASLSHQLGITTTNQLLQPYWNLRAGKYIYDLYGG